MDASFLPISVIIIGIGKNDFTNMDQLDADEEPLYNSNGVKAARDLVQFVPFYKFQNDETKLAKEVLAEIPTQIEEFYKMIRKSPNDPIM